MAKISNELKLDVGQCEKSERLADEKCHDYSGDIRERNRSRITDESETRRSRHQAALQK
jgi:hypothetical protein